MSISCDNLKVYVFPSTAILAKVLQKLQCHPCEMILLAPLWPKQRLFPFLEMLVDYPLELPWWPRLLKLPLSDIYHLNPEVYNLHALRLSSWHTEIEGFHQRLQRECQKHRKSPVCQCIKGNGDSLVVGVRKGISIHSKLLVQ